MRKISEQKAFPLGVVIEAIIKKIYPNEGVVPDDEEAKKAFLLQATKNILPEPKGNGEGVTSLLKIFRLNSKEGIVPLEGVPADIETIEDLYLTESMFNLLSRRICVYVEQKIDQYEVLQVTQPTSIDPQGGEHSL